jgi:hypothetical protein
MGLDRTRWLAGVAEGPGGAITLMLQNWEGVVCQGGPSSLLTDLRAAGATVEWLTLDLASLSRGSTREYLHLIDASGWDAGGQTTYCAHVDALLQRDGTWASDVKVWIPAQLLLNALLAPVESLRRWLFQPTAYADYIHVLHGDRRRGLRFEFDRQRWYGRRTSEHNNEALALVQWLKCYPSAIAACGSVYESVSRGALDIRMPKCTVQFRALVVTKGEHLAVTGLQARRIWAQDEPLSFAVGRVPQDFIVGRISAAKRRHIRKGVRAKELLRPTLKDGGFTPEQKAALTVKLKGTLVRHPRARLQGLDCLDILLVKFGTPLSWEELPITRLEKFSARRYYVELVRAGKWPTVAKAMKRVSEWSEAKSTPRPPQHTGGAPVRGFHASGRTRPKPAVQ